jgi:outer membrane protein assembly factor BamB
MTASSYFEFTITFLNEYGIWCLIGMIALFFCSLWIWTAIENRKEKESKPKYVNKATFIKIIAVMLLPFLTWLFIGEINPSYLGYGYSTNGLDIIAHGDNALCVMDYITQSAGKGGSIAIYRIQGLNMNTGIKEFRKLISHKCEAQGANNNLVWIKVKEGRNDYNLTGITINSGETIKTITKDYLTQHVPELNAGVYEFDYNPKTLLLDVTSKDGLKLAINPESNAKIDSVAEKEVRRNLDTHVITDNAGNRIITLDRQGEREKLADKNGKTIPSDLFFLKSQFLQIDTIAQQVFIFSYQTLEKKNFLIRCVSLDGKLIWEASQENMKVGDFFESEPRFRDSFFYKENLIVGVDGFVFSLNKQTGQLNWVTRF